LQARTDLMSQGEHTACPGEGNAQPIQVVAVARTWLGSEGAPDSAAYRGVVCKASIAVGGGGRSGS
jgi:hypothetical protein